MEIYSNYKKYKQFKPEYKTWKEKQNELEAKRQEYLRQHPEEINQDDIKRSKALLHAIDVMDEYSQKNAEDMEVASEMAASQAMQVANYIGMGIGAGALALPPVAKGISKISAKYPKLGFAMYFLPIATGYLASIISSFPIMSKAAQVQVSASRQGRFEAMRKDLSNPNNFAVLTDEQLKQAEENAKDIKIEEKKKDFINIGFKDVFKNLKKMILKDKEYESQRAQFEKTIKENEKHFNDELSDTDIQKAKRDQQLLTKLVEKIDIASQDYAENVEMATNTAASVAMGGGLVTGWITDKIIKVLHLSNQSKPVKALPYVVGIGISLISAVYANKIQKQASRVGRFKAKQELMQNPSSLVYVDDKKANEIQNYTKIKEKEKPNFFKFLVQVYKDNKEYEAYQKKEGLENKKLRKAIEKIQLSDEQIKDAKALQQSTFKTFNTVDDKSQTYAESVEALGQSIQIPLTLVGSALGMGLGYLFNRASILNIMKSSNSAIKATAGIIPKFITGIVAGFAPVIASEYYITKEQKQASRIADMLAIKELEDYRHFVDYQNIDKTKNTETSNTNNEYKLSDNSKSLLEMLKK